MKQRALSTISLTIIALSTNAEVTLDGTLGRTGPLPGPTLTCISLILMGLCLGLMPS